MQADLLEALLTENVLLSQHVRARAAFVSHELDRLRALRTSVACNHEHVRKRRRDMEGAVLRSSFTNSVGRPGSHHAAFQQALQAAVRSRACKGAPHTLTVEEWTDIAAALHAAGYPSYTAHELLTVYKRCYYTNAAFSVPEVEALCLLVKENGYNWAVVSKALSKRFGHERQPFDLARHYRFRMRRALVQRRLTAAQLRELLRSEAASATGCDSDHLSVVAKRFTSGTSIQVDPRYLQKQIDAVTFMRSTEPSYWAYWRVVNLICHLPLPPEHCIATYHHQMPFCFQQRSLEELSLLHECTATQLRERIVGHLLSLSRSPKRLDCEECSRKLFGNSSAARVIYQIANEVHDCAPSTSTDVEVP